MHGTEEKQVISRRYARELDARGCTAAPATASTNASAAASRVANREIAPLVSGYFELAPGPWSADEQMELALATARACDLPRLRALGRAVGDPTPWAVILQHLAVIPPERRSHDVLRTVAVFYAKCSEMLREQGLELVRPEDLLRREPPYVTLARDLLDEDERDFNTTPYSPW